jgi:hypothetical protein
MSSNIVTAQLEKPRPLPIRLFNFIGYKAKLDEATLMNAAMKQAGLKNFGDEYWRPNLSKLIEAIENESKVHAWGRFITQQRLVSLLANRLCAEYWLNKHPEILEQELKPIVMITGLQRTGTTMLQRLLAAHPQALSILSWEALSPAPWLVPNEKEKRIAQARLSEKALKYMAPEFFAIHPVEHLAPEEEILLLDMSFLSTVPEATLMVPQYAKWLEQQDQTPAYAYMRKMLLLLQWQKQNTNATHWILKTPHHLEWLDTMVKVFPETKIVWGHRDPTVAITSFLSMAYHGMRIFSDEVTKEYAGHYWTNKDIYMLNKAMDYRDKNGSDRFIDISYYALIKDTFSEVEKLYKHCGIEFNDTVKSALQQRKAENKQHKYGVHKYTLSDYNITPEYIEQHTAAYRQRFNIPAEN